MRFVMSRATLLVYGLLLLAPVIAYAATLEPRLQLSVEAHARAPGSPEWRTIRPGQDELSNSEAVRLMVKVDQNAYIYVVDTSGSGTPHLLHPRRSADLYWPMNTDLQVPTGGRLLFLNEKPGADEFVVVASKTPLPRERVTQLLSKRKSANLPNTEAGHFLGTSATPRPANQDRPSPPPPSPAEKKEPPPPREGRGPKERDPAAYTRSASDVDATLRSGSDEDGIALIRVSIPHQ